MGDAEVLAAQRLSDELFWDSEAEDSEGEQEQEQEAQAAAAAWRWPDAWMAPADGQPFFRLATAPLGNPCARSADAARRARHPSPLLGESRPWGAKEARRLVQMFEGGAGGGSAATARGLAGRPAEACRVRYREFLAPDVNRSKFSKQEDTRLARLVANRSASGDWFEVAAQLSEGAVKRRTAWQCLRRFESKLRPTVRNSAAEDAALLRLVELLGESSAALIAELMQHVNRRSAKQYLLRYRQSLKDRGAARRGRRFWTAQDDRRLRVVVRAYPSLNWTLIRRHMAGLNDLQCRERWCNVLDPALGRVGADGAVSAVAWAPAEEAALRSAVARLGFGNWTAVSRAVNEQCPGPRRTAKLCKLRYKTLGDGAGQDDADDEVEARGVDSISPAAS